MKQKEGGKLKYTNTQIQKYKNKRKKHTQINIHKKTRNKNDKTHDYHAGVGCRGWRARGYAKFVLVDVNYIGAMAPKDTPTRLSNPFAFYRGEMPGVQGIPHWRGGRFQRPVQARRFFPAVLDYRPLVHSQVQGWL